MAGRPWKYTEADRHRMRDLYEKYGNMAEVGRQVGCHTATVRYILDSGYRERQRTANRLRNWANYIPVESVELVQIEPRPIDYNPLYDPLRDGKPIYVSPAAEWLGDPPVGRREMIAKHVPDANYAAWEEYDREDGA